MARSSAFGVQTGPPERGARRVGSRAPPARRPPPSSLWILAALLVLPELILSGADQGLWGSPSWRPLAYSQFGFWAGLLHGWRPNYPAQTATMFFTYGALHAGPAHLAGNLMALFWLGPLVQRQVGRVGFWTIWAAAWLAGAAAFGLLSRAPAPMVGASGALFGLAGAWLAWEAEDRLAEGIPLRRAALRVGAVVLVFALLNLITWKLQNGQLAWQTHLGGALAGAALAPWFRRG